jgi:hypothetical protein
MQGTLQLRVVAVNLDCGRFFEVLTQGMGSPGEATVIWYNERERGYRIEAGDDTHQGIIVSCTVCSHSTKMHWTMVTSLWRPGTYTRDMAASLRCTQCGERKAQVMTWAWGPAD